LCSLSGFLNRREVNASIAALTRIYAADLAPIPVSGGPEREHEMNSEQAIAAPVFKPLPYGFARRYGVFLEPGASPAEAAVLCYRPGLTPAVLAEVTRVAQVPFHCRELDADQFERALAHAYQR